MREAAGDGNRGVGEPARLGVRAATAAGMRASPSSALIAAACGLAALGAAREAAAEECSGDYDAELFAPGPGQVDQPTHAHLWMLFSRVNRVWLSTTPLALHQPIETRLVQHEHGGELFTEAIPLAPLAPRTKYYVQVERPSSEILLYDFTTGDRAHDAAPSPPAEPLYVFTWRYERPLRCLPGKYLFRMLMPGGRSPGSLYALEKKTASGFERIAFSDVPDFITYGDELPSPFYRIRPMSISGAGANPTSLQVVRAERVDKVERGLAPSSREPPPLPDDGAWDDEENWAGCAAGGGGGLWGSAVVVAAVGAARRRGRRGGAGPAADRSFS